MNPSLHSRVVVPNLLLGQERVAVVVMVPICGRCHCPHPVPFLGEAQPGCACMLPFPDSQPGMLRCGAGLPAVVHSCAIFLAQNTW